MRRERGGGDGWVHLGESGDERLGGENGSEGRASFLLVTRG